MATLSMRQAVTLYRAGNNAGAGYEIDGDTVDEAAREAGNVILSRQTTDDVAVALVGRDLIAVGGDGMGRSPWAVTILTPLQVTALRSEASAAGDLEQVAVCDRALDGDAGALLSCASVLADAKAMA